ncbi:MAG: hypothetical protein R3F39_21000 [Myxococcota bacterium]
MRAWLVALALCVASGARAAGPLFAMDQAASVEVQYDGSGQPMRGGPGITVYTAGFGLVASADRLEVQDRATGAVTTWPASDLVDPKVGVSFGDRVTMAAGVGPDMAAMDLVLVHAGQFGDFRGLLLLRTDAFGVPKMLRSVGVGDFAPGLASWLVAPGPCPDGGCAFGDKLTSFGVASSAARSCVATRDGIVCVEVSGAPAVRLRMPLSALDAIPAAPIAQSLGWDPVYGFGPNAETWTLGPIAGAADGRVWFVADRQFVQVPEQGPSTVRQTARYVIELGADGQKLTVLDGPHVGEGPLSAVTHLGFDSRLGALVAFPGPQWDPVALSYYGGGDGTGGVLSGQRPFFGLSMRVIAVDGSGAGYVSLTDSVARRLRCVAGNGGGLGKALTAGSCFFGTVAPALAVAASAGPPKVGLAFAGGPVDTGAAPGMVFGSVDFVVDRLDLDGDGLDAATERGLGTSDFSRDSDGGETNDFEEHVVAGTDPTAPVDDPSLVGGARRATVIYSQSTDISRHLPAMSELAGQPAQTPGSAGPACSRFRCYGRDGAVLVDFSDLAATGPAVRSVDGSFVVVPTGPGLVRVFIADGRRELYVSGPEYLALLPAGAIVPVDVTRTWLVSLDQAKVALFVDGEAPRVLLDVEAERCAAGLGQCDKRAKPATELFVNYINGFPTYVPMPTEDVRSVGYIGYNDVLGRIELFVQGTLEAWWVGVDESGPVVVARGRELAGLNAAKLPESLATARALPPAFFMATGHGDFLTDTNVRDPWLGSRSTLSRQESFEPFGTRPFTAWDGVMLRGVSVNGVSQLSELVRYDEGLDPGDVVYLAEVAWPYGEGTSETDRLPRTMLYRVGPRGGAVPLWEMGRRDILRPVSVAVAAAGWMCIVDSRDVAGFPGDAGARVTLLGPLPTRGGIPGQPYGALELADATACAFDDDGALLTLHTSPPRIERRTSSAAGPGTGAPTTTALALPDGLPPDARPASFFHSATGFEANWSGGQYASASALLDDGRVARIDHGGLTIDGTPAHPRLAGYIGTGLYPSTAPLYGSPTLIDRGQGDLVIVGLAYPAVGMNLGSGELWDLTPEWGRVRAIARVPGGERAHAVDPWTGRPVTRTPIVVEVGPGGEPAPAVPVAPVAPEIDGSERIEASGCGGGGDGSPWAAVWVWVLAGGLAQRRRPALAG